MKWYKMIFLLLSIMFYTCKKEDKKPEINKEAPKQSKPILDAIIAKEEVSSNVIQTTGTVLANEEVDLKSEISGVITKIYFREGSSVSKGQILVKLKDDDLLAQLSKLNIEVEQQKIVEERQKQLLNVEAISKEQYESALNSLNLMKANIGILKTQIEKTKMVAPFSGIVGLKNVSEGAFITSSTIIASIQSINPLKLDFSVPEKYNNLVKIGSSIDFTVTGEGKHQAKVYAKEPKIDPVTRTSKVRASFANPSGKVFPGSFAEINIQVGQNTKAIMLPTVAYIPDINGAKVYVSKGGKAVSVKVTAGLRTENQIQIVSGVNVGDTVLTSGILQLKPKMPIDVNIVNPEN